VEVVETDLVEIKAVQVVVPVAVDPMALVIKKLELVTQHRTHLHNHEH
jgi:hypothetical protein